MNNQIHDFDNNKFVEFEVYRNLHCEPKKSAILFFKQLGQNDLVFAFLSIFVITQI